MCHLITIGPREYLIWSLESLKLFTLNLTDGPGSPGKKQRISIEIFCWHQFQPLKPNQVLHMLWLIWFYLGKFFFCLAYETSCSSTLFFGKVIPKEIFDNELKKKGIELRTAPSFCLLAENVWHRFYAFLKLIGSHRYQFCELQIKWNICKIRKMSSLIVKTDFFWNTPFVFVHKKHEFTRNFTVGWQVHGISESRQIISN